MTSLLDRIFWRRRCRAFLKPFVNAPAALVVGEPPANTLIPLHQLQSVELARESTSIYWAVDLVYNAVELEVYENIVAANVAAAVWILLRTFRFIQIKPTCRRERWRFLLKGNQLEAYEALQEIIDQ